MRSIRRPPHASPPASKINDIESSERADRGFLWSLGGGLLAGLCCVGPLTAVLIGGGGAAGTVGLVRFKIEFIAVGLLVTLIGIGLTLRRNKTCCSVTTYRRNRILIPAVSLTDFAVLVVGSNVVLLNNRVIDAVSARLTAEHEQPQRVTAAPLEHEPVVPAEVQAPVARQLDVAITDGVWCAACLVAVEDGVLQTPGVPDLTFVKELSSSGYYVIRVLYDPADVNTTELLTVIAHASGAIGGLSCTELVADGPEQPNLPFLKGFA